MVRGFSVDEQISDHPDAVALSYTMWLQSFAGDRIVLGKAVHLATPEADFFSRHL